MSNPNFQDFDDKGFNEQLSSLWPRLRHHVGYRYPALDCFEADEVTQDVMMRYYRYASSEYLLAGNRKPVEHPQEYWPLLVGKMLMQAAIQKLREKRRQPGQLDPDDTGAVYENVIDSKGRSLNAVQAAEYAQHLPEFFHRISNQGILEPLQQIVRERGAKALDDEFVYLHDYLFDYKSLGNHDKRASITRKLCEDTGKNRSAVDVALLRLRGAWKKALSVFHGRKRSSSTSKYPRLSVNS